jgi:pimeloyl-ACP methyl ester carboxylesterase
VSAAYEATTLRYITTTDTVTLAIHRLGAPDGPPVLLVPGTFSNASFWLGTRGVGFARFLAGCGYDVWVLEPRGHGSSARPTNAQRWDFDDWAKHDVPAALHACTSHTNPAVIVGHSAGGAATVAALARDPLLQARVRGIVIIGTPLPWLQKWRGLAAHAIRTYARHTRWFPARALRIGPEDELAGVMEQWMTWNIESKWMGDDGTDYGARFDRLSVPALVVAATADTMWAPPRACRALFDLIGSRDKTFLQCGLGTGFGSDFGHVDIMVSREARAEVWPLIRNWIAALR